MNIIKRPVKNFSSREGNPVLFIVNHIIQGSIASAESWFNNPKSLASSNYGVGKDGKIYEWVPVAKKAWANGKVNNPNNPVWAECGQINPNLVSISIEHEGNTGEPMPEQQYQSTLVLHRYLIQTYDIKVDDNHIIGHYIIDPVNKANCPGNKFPWKRLFDDLKKPFISDDIKTLMDASIISTPEHWINHNDPYVSKLIGNMANYIMAK